MKSSILNGMCASFILLHSSCSMIMAPNLGAYHFQGKNELRISPALGSAAGAEAQVAWSPLKHLFVKSGIRYEKKGGMLGYSDIVNYSSQNAGFGFYAWLGAHSYFQLGGEYIWGAGNNKRIMGGGQVRILAADMRINGPAFSGLYTVYSASLEIGLGIGARLGPITRIETNTGGYNYNVPNEGIEMRSHSTYKEYSVSIFHMFKNQASLSFNIGSVASGDNKSFFVGRLAAQIPIRLKPSKKL